MAGRSRSDGRENRAAVLRAAHEAYAELGPDVPLATIADRAGLSRTSVARHFATRADLEYALADAAVARIETRAAGLMGRPDALRVLFRFILELQSETNYLYPFDAGSANTAAPLAERVSAAFRAVGATDTDDLMMGIALGAGITSPGLSVTDRDRAWRVIERGLF